MKGRPREPSDAEVLGAVQQASAAGVAFPLTSTYYLESLTTRDPRQRIDLARTIASISNCCALRSRRQLLRHQMLHAMWMHFGRPTFRPRPPEALGVGVFWAFLGKQVPLRVSGPDGPLDPDTIPGLPQRLRQMAQWAEVQFLSGARDEELTDLRQRGYRPEVSIEAGQQRLASEQHYIGMLAGDPIGRNELRVRLQARELIYEHLDLFNEVLAEYRISIDRAFGIDTNRQGSGRRKAVAFADAIPTMRLAVDLKYHLFRDSTKNWETNHLYDIDALSLAIPYCHAVLGDSEMTALLNRSDAGQRNGTVILASMSDLVEVLPDLSATAAERGGDPTGWDWAGPGEGFCLDLPDAVSGRS